MQQRQYRPGDVLDDYCPRERRITDHAIVAMVEDEVQRTRCVSCDAEHEFKNGRVPAPRKKPSTAALFAQVLDSAEAPAGRLATPAPSDNEARTPEVPATPAAADPVGETSAEPPSPPDADDRPFRRSLIRAQLPRPEGQPPPARAIPEFTMHQPPPPRGKRHGRFRRRPAGALDGGGPMRFGREQGNTNGGGQGGRRRRRKKH
ncbi:MAG: hypothetical protein IT177_09125 [Acidobacteria bacterium]|nr:hypothetical protein [Acidobacteriota bacterium]